MPIGVAISARKMKTRTRGTKNHNKGMPKPNNDAADRVAALEIK
jgi:hypothetical protein